MSEVSQTRQYQFSDEKTRHINVRVSASEHAEIVQRAHAAGLSISEYVRRAALRDDRPTIYVDSEILKKLYRDFRHAGGNLNQIAHELHIHHQPYGLEDALAATFETVSVASDAVAQFIADVRNSV